MTTEKTSSTRLVNKFKEFARVVIEHHFGSRPKRIEHKAEGLSNFVFMVAQGTDKYIVRMSGDAAALNHFIKEQWCQMAAHKAGLPTAEILEVGCSIIPQPYMIVRHVVGQAASSHPDRLDILRQMGELARRVNAIPTHGYGATFDWSNNQLSLNSSWHDYLESEFRYKERVEFLVGRKLITDRQAKRLTDVMSQAAKLKPRPRLCHGDVRLKNVIVDKRGKIAALLDWEKATSNIAPQWELAIALHDLGIDEMQAFTLGYGLTARSLSEMAPLIKTFNILNYVAEAQRLTHIRDRKALDHIKARFQGLFDLYSV